MICFVSLGQFIARRRKNVIMIRNFQVILLLTKVIWFNKFADCEQNIRVAK